MVLEWFYFNDIGKSLSFQISNTVNKPAKDKKRIVRERIDYNLWKNILKLERIYNKPSQVYAKFMTSVVETPFPALSQLTILPSNYCPKCAVQYDKHDHSLQMVCCDICDRWFHRKCENITKERYKSFNNNWSIFICRLCSQWFRNINKLEKKFLIFNQKRIQGAFKKINKDSQYKGNTGEQKPNYSFLLTEQIPLKFKEFLRINPLNRPLTKLEDEIFEKYRKENRVCLSCQRIGATIICVVCKDACFHLQCMKLIMVSGMSIPSCEKHRVSYIFPYVGINVGLRNNDYVYYNEDWYGRVLQNHFLERRADYLFLDSYPIQISTLDKVLNNSGMKILEMSLSELFGLVSDEFKLFKEKLRNRPELLMNDQFDVNLLEMQALLGEDVKLRYNTTYCIASEALKTNVTLTHLFTHLKQNKPLLSKSNIEGYGLFSERLYDKNEPIIAYIGDPIENSESDRRERSYGDRVYMFRQNKDQVIDATVFGNLAKYINHSCDPNCYATKINCGKFSGVIICAKRIISKNEELFYDYDLSKGITVFKCRCNSQKCRQIFE